MKNKQKYHVGDTVRLVTKRTTTGKIIAYIMGKIVDIDAKDQPRGTPTAYKVRHEPNKHLQVSSQENTWHYAVQLSAPG